MPVPKKIVLTPLPDSTARADSMSAIDKALGVQATPVLSQSLLAARAPDDIVAQVASGGETTPLDAMSIPHPEENEAQALDLQEQQEVAAWRKILGGPGAEGLAAVVKTLRKARSGGNRGAGRIKGGLATVPIPGDIGVPLLLLIVLFMALVSVNGHTRFSWLWLVLTGKAHINPNAVTGGTTAVTQAVNAVGTAIVDLGNPLGVSSNPWSVPSSNTLAAQGNPYNNPYGLYNPSAPNLAKTGFGTSYADVLSAGSGGD